MDCPVCGLPHPDLYRCEGYDGELPVCASCNDARIWVRERLFTKYAKAQQRGDPREMTRIGRMIWIFDYREELQ